MISNMSKCIFSIVCKGKRRRGVGCTARLVFFKSLRSSSPAIIKSGQSRCPYSHQMCPALFLNLKVDYSFGTLCSLDQCSLSKSEHII